MAEMQSKAWKVKQSTRNWLNFTPLQMTRLHLVTCETPLQPDDVACTVTSFQKQPLNTLFVRFHLTLLPKLSRRGEKVASPNTSGTTPMDWMDKSPGVKYCAMVNLRPDFSRS